ncbi:hypothetical protein BU16DRAFT_45388 [Lophium mytilinum]|uniref:Uncharacterized protein n=1 Tax=Lophium mytilinum TaxID=390894 RepID=A0A6A6QSF1_9PEZI|nr:hypothetical protein BU16DRAFT_45388 [Lophium mytilinum]
MVDISVLLPPPTTSSPRHVHAFTRHETLLACLLQAPRSSTWLSAAYFFEPMKGTKPTVQAQILSRRKTFIPHRSYLAREYHEVSEKWAVRDVSRGRPYTADKATIFPLATCIKSASSASTLGLETDFGDFASEAAKKSHAATLWQGTKQEEQLRYKIGRGDQINSNGAEWLRIWISRR